MAKNNGKRPVYNAQGRVCGAIEGGRLTKLVRGKHMLQRPPGWAWDKTILLAAQAGGVVETELYDQDSGVYYTAPIREFWENGVEIDRGFGPQVVLPLVYWQTRRRNEPRAAQPSLI